MPRQRTCADGRDRPQPPSGPVWPAAELDESWDEGLSRWRYRRLLTAVAARNAYYPRHLPDYPAAQWEVLVDVPVPVGWTSVPGRTSLAAYGCVGTLLSGDIERRPNGEGTVLAYFPLVALRVAVTARLYALGERALAQRTRRQSPRLVAA